MTAKDKGGSSATVTLTVTVAAKVKAKAKQVVHGAATLQGHASGMRTDALPTCR